MKSIASARRISIGAIALCLLLLLGWLVPARSSVVPDSKLSPTSAGSWNTNISCPATLVTISTILGSSYPSQSLQGSQYRTSDSAGGVPYKRALSPPCNVTNADGQAVSTFVEIDNLTLQNYFYETRDCSTTYQPINGGGSYGETICDSTGDAYQSASPSASVHLEMDQDWMAKGYCGPTSAICNNNTIVQVPTPCTIPVPCASNVPVNIQGFVFWDPEGHWEIHPLTAWKLTMGGSPGGSNGGSAGSFSTSLWLLVLAGALGVVGSLALVTARARARLRLAKNRLGKQDETLTIRLVADILPRSQVDPTKWRTVDCCLSATTRSMF